LFGYSVSDSDIQPVTLGGANFSERADVNAAVYGAKIRNAAILSGAKPERVPAAAREFVAALHSIDLAGKQEHAGN